MSLRDLILKWRTVHRLHAIEVEGLLNGQLSKRSLQWLAEHEKGAIRGSG